MTPSQIVDALIDPSEHSADWSGAVVYHGTGRSHASSIASGIRVEKSCGYFGYGFYVADDPMLAKNNYADFSDDEPAILKFRIATTARIADMRVEGPLEALFQKVSQQGRGLGCESTTKRMVQAGIDGVYDRSMGGLCIYNPAVLTPLGEWKPGQPV